MNNEIHESMNGGSSKRSGGGKGFCLARDIAEDDLRDAEQVDQLWELARAHPVTSGLLRDPEEDERDRVVFFAFAYHCWRQREAFDSPVGFFHHVLQQGVNAMAAQCDDAKDWEWGRSASRKLSAPEAVLNSRASSVAAVVDPEAVEYRQHEKRRTAQMRALYEAQKRGEV